MRYLTALFCTLTLTLLLSPAARGTGESRQVEVQFHSEQTMTYDAPTLQDRVTVTLDGAELELDVPALIRSGDGGDGRTLVPVRPLAQALGAEVDWLPEGRQVVLTRGEDTVRLTLGEARAAVNGAEAALPGGVAPAVARVGGVERTLIPLRFLAEVLGLTVTWEGAAFTAHLTSPGGAFPFTVALDAGHGGWSSGAVYGGVLEKDLNLPIALRVGELLSDRVRQVVMVRSKDEYIDLYDRCDIANAAGADLFLSIHCNANENSDIQGVFTYSYPGSEPGEALAGHVQREVARATGGVDRGLLTNDYVVLRETAMPAALLECGFLSNPAERLRLADPAYQEQIAQGAAAGILAYLATLTSFQ